MKTINGENTMQDYQTSHNRLRGLSHYHGYTPKWVIFSYCVLGFAIAALFT